MMYKSGYLTQKIQKNSIKNGKLQNDDARAAGAFRQVLLNTVNAQIISESGLKSLVEHATRHG